MKKKKYTILQINNTYERDILMSLVNQGAQPASTPLTFGRQSHNKSPEESRTASPWMWRLFFLVLLILFYCLELFFIRPVDGINDDWGMYSILSGAYLGYPDAHVMFFLYPLSWLLCQLYKLWSFIPWYGLFQHGVQIACLSVVYHRAMRIWHRYNSRDAFFKPALTTFLILFLLVNLNVLSEAQYTTTAGLAAAAAIFCFITTRINSSVPVFFVDNIPAILLAWISFSMRQNILYLMLPMAGMIWLSKWIIARHNGSEKIALKLLGFALLLGLGMGILWGINAAAYSAPQWSDFRKINHYRERVGDFYQWPEYEECAEDLTALGITEEAYMYRRNGAPYIGHDMSVNDWKQMHDIARKCYLARTSMRERLKNVITGSINVFFYEDGMQPANLLAGLLILLTFLLILIRRNWQALTVYLCYLFGRSVSWIYVLYEGRFPKRIIQPLITVDFMILFGILLGFNLLRLETRKRYALILPLFLSLSVLSLYLTKVNVDENYHAHEKNWEELKAYCHAHPDNFYIWTYDSGTLENYCESPFDTTLDTYNNFFYTNWGVVCNPNSKIKLTAHGIGDFGRDVVENDHVYFILREAPFNREHPVIMYFRHTYNVESEIADVFTAGDTVYHVYQLR